MTWTATLTGLEKSSGMWIIGILYTDTVSGKTFSRNYDRARITKKQLRDLVRAEVLRLIEIETTDIDIPIGTTVDVTPDPVIPPDPPTAAELANRAWFDDWRQLNQLITLTTAVPALETAQATTLMANLRASLESDWLNRYLGNI